MPAGAVLSPLHLPRIVRVIFFVPFFPPAAPGGVKAGGGLNAFSCILFWALLSTACSVFQGICSIPPLFFSTLQRVTRISFACAWCLLKPLWGWYLSSCPSAMPVFCSSLGGLPSPLALGHMSSAPTLPTVLTLCAKLPGSKSSTLSLPLVWIERGWKPLILKLPAISRGLAGSSLCPSTRRLFSMFFGPVLFGHRLGGTLTETFCSLPALSAPKLGVPLAICLQSVRISMALSAHWNSDGMRVPPNVWISQPRVTAKSGWITTGASPYPDVRATLQVAACALGIL